MASIGTTNDAGENVDLYIPRKCHASNTLIPSFDHGSIQIAIGNVDSNGVYIAGETHTLCIAGFLRSQGAGDHAINHLCIEHGIIRGRTGRQTKASKKKQADAKKRFAGRGAQKPKGKKGGKFAAGQRGGARPAGKFGPRPDGKRGPRPEGGARPERGARPEGKRGPRPEGAAGQERGPRPEGKRGPRPEGAAHPRGPRPEGAAGQQRGPRPDGAQQRGPRPAPKAAAAQ